MEIVFIKEMEIPDIIEMIDQALDLYKDRQYVTQREYTDILLDMRLALMEGELSGIIQDEVDALAGVGDNGPS